MTVTKQKITLNIHGIHIPMEIDLAEEAVHRKAAQIINERLNRYFGAYDGVKSTEEIYCYTLIDITLRLIKEQGARNIEEIHESLAELTAEIAEALKRN